MATAAGAIADDDPWALAKARFLSDLDPEERELFDKATLENIYYSASNVDRDDAEKSKTRILVRKLGPLVSAIESYGKAFDTFANIAPLYLSPIWGCIRVVLVVASVHGKFYDGIVDTLSRIGDILPRFRKLLAAVCNNVAAHNSLGDYERIYDRRKHQRLTQALSYAYLDIILLCTEFRKLIRKQTTSSVHRILKPLSLDRQYDEALERFRQHRQNVDEEARTCHMIEAAEQRDAQLVLLATERRRKLLRKLSSVDCRHKLRKLKEARHDGTGLWLTACPEYGNWEASESSSVLWCYGIRESCRCLPRKSILTKV